MMRSTLGLAFVVAVLGGLILAGCGNSPDNIAMPPADKREKEAKVIIPPLNQK
jgi:outer membrane murein-binding lipoprotein Lpp